jgi:hypothetical protein
MKYYLLLDKNNIIQDAISYPTDGYIEVEVDKPFPAGINGGWYKWENDTYVEIPELKPKGIDRELLETVLQRIDASEQAILALMEVI